MSDTEHETGGCGFRHEAVIYSDDDEFLDGTLQFLRDGFHAGEPALVVVSRPKIRALRAELRGDGERLTFADVDVIGRNPACIIPMWARFVADEGRRHTRDHHTRVRGVGEPVSPESTTAELEECDLHERLLNVAFDATSDFWLRCPYDAARLERDIIEGVHDSHDHVVRDRVSESVELDRGRLLASFAAPLVEVPASASSYTFDDDEGITHVRELVSCRAREVGLTAAAVEDIVLAVHEIATNSIRYGGGSGTLRIWHDDCWLICDVHDRGHITDPLVGRRPPSPFARGGRGVWMANHLADLVQLRSSAAGTTVRIYARRSR